MGWIEGQNVIKGTYSQFKALITFLSINMPHLTEGVNKSEIPPRIVLGSPLILLPYQHIHFLPMYIQWPSFTYKRAHTHLHTHTHANQWR